MRVEDITRPDGATKVIFLFLLERDDGLLLRKTYVNPDNAENYLKAKIPEPDRWRVVRFRRANR